MKKSGVAALGGVLASIAVLSASVVLMGQSNPGLLRSGAVASNDCAAWVDNFHVKSTGTPCIAGSASALSTADDTNIHIAATGTPGTALLQPVTLTMSWAGTLALSRLAQGTDGQLIVGQTGIAPLYKTITGDWTMDAAGAATLATVNADVGSFGSTTQCVAITVNAKGLITAASAATCAPAASSITGGAALTKTDDTNVTLTLGGTPGSALLTAASITAGWTGQLSIARGGTGAATQQAAFDALAPTATRAGDIIYWNGTHYVNLAGNNSGTKILQEDASGVPSWVAASGTGTVTSITPGGGQVSGITTSCDQTAITTAGTLSSAHCINAQTGTTYAIADGDRGKLITATNNAAQAYSIAQAGAASAFANGWYTDIRNTSANVAGVVTITPTTSTIAGAATYKIYPGQMARVVSDGTNYQIAATGGNTAIPTIQYLTSGSSATYTPTSAAVRYIKVTLKGGGGGSAGSGTSPSAAGAGGNSTFGSLTANGGSAGLTNASVSGGTASGGQVNLTGGQGGGAFAVTTAPGGNGGANGCGGAFGAISGQNNAGLSPPANSGGGASGAGDLNTVNSGGGGGGGGCAISYLAATTYTYTIGAGGTAGGAGTSGSAGAAGATGAAIVEEFYN